MPGSLRDSRSGEVGFNLWSVVHSSSNGDIAFSRVFCRTASAACAIDGATMGAKHKHERAATAIATRRAQLGMLPTTGRTQTPARPLFLACPPPVPGSVPTCPAPL